MNGGSGRPAGQLNHRLKAGPHLRDTIEIAFMLLRLGIKGWPGSANIEQA